MGTRSCQSNFFHGGPGQAVVDYNDSNFEILDPEKYTVVEPDQLGTGSSLPTIRETMQNANLYEKVTPQDIARALSDLLDHLGWKKVYLHGGSWGSTLALLFAQLFPEKVIGMVLRGIFLGTRAEIDGFYQINESQSPNIKTARKKLSEFMKKKGFTGDVTNGEQVLGFFLKYFLTAPLPERDVAAFNLWVHERFFMDEIEPGFVEEFSEISSHRDLPEARSVAFWEVSVMYHFLFEKELDLLANIQKLPKVPISIVHGKGDLLCPSTYAEMLENALKKHGYEVTASYIDSGHKISNNPIREGVRQAAERFATKYISENPYNL